MLAKIFRFFLFGRYSWIAFISLAVAIYLVISLAPLRYVDLPDPEGKFEAPVLAELSYRLPKVIHQMWKDEGVPLPSDLSRWKTGCQKVNPDYEFKMYYDKGLLGFVEKEYPQYLPLFSSLYGVYMADMARVLIAYHHGGLYMDLDFYCHRPFVCLEEILSKELVKFKSKDLCIVSLEPAMHAHLFRNKDRVVIQDFYFCTPKHPFLKWLLDDRMQLFEKGEKSKGPFSYSIESDIDRYRAQVMKQMSKNMTLNDLIDAKFFEHAGDILELPEAVVHPLVDSSNSKLWKACDDISEADKLAARDAADTENTRTLCDAVKSGKFFNPQLDITIASHMWSHVYLVSRCCLCNIDDMIVYIEVYLSRVGMHSAVPTVLACTILSRRI